MPQTVIRICTIIIILLCPKLSPPQCIYAFKACGTLKTREEEAVARRPLIYFFFLSQSRAAIRRGNQEGSPLEAGKRSQEAEEREREGWGSVGVGGRGAGERVLDRFSRRY